MGLGVAIADYMNREEEGKGIARISPWRKTWRSYTPSGAFAVLGQVHSKAKAQ